MRDAVQSVLDQTFSDFELIIIDDGSTDETDEVVRGFNDRRLRYLRQENKGRSAARNKALSLARGSHIAFLDSDDLYLEDKLAKQVAFMAENPHIDMLYTSAICVDDAGRPMDKQVYFAEVEGDIYRYVAFFRPVTITLPTVMLRRKVLDTVGYFDEQMDRFEDTDLWRRIAKRFKVGILREPTCILKTHDDNALTAQNPTRIIGAIDYYVEKVFREDADIEMAFLKDGASRLYEYYGRAFLAVEGWRHFGLQLLRKAIMFQPRRGASICLSACRTFSVSLIRRETNKSP